MLKVNGQKYRELEKNVLNEAILGHEKYYEELKTLSAPSIYLWDKPYDHAFVYTLYGHEMYLTYIRYSIMSLRVVCPNAKIVIFVEAEMWQKAKDELKHLVFEHDIKFVNGKAACYKQVIACHSELQRFKVCTFVDADLFFLGNEDGTMYQVTRDLKILLMNRPDAFVWAFARKEMPDISNTVMHRRGRIATTTPDTYIWDMEEELDYDIVGLIETQKIWNISYIFSFCPKKLVTPEYKSWAMYSMFNNNHCDETVWYLWGKKNDYKNYHWSTHFKDYLSISSTTHKSDKKVHLFQPMFTDTMQTKTHRKFETMLAILEIESKYRRLINDRLQQQQV